MTHHRRRFHSSSTVPFAWEDHPGVSKISAEPTPRMKLPPPPCIDSPKLAKPGIYVPPPPCPFQPLPRRYSVLRADDDPFLAAYMKCTKSGKAAGPSPVKGGGLWKDGLGLGLSCGRNCGVRDDCLVRVVRLPAYHGRKSSFSSKESKDWDCKPRPSSFIL